MVLKMLYAVELPNIKKGCSVTVPESQTLFVMVDFFFFSGSKTKLFRGINKLKLENSNFGACNENAINGRFVRLQQVPESRWC